MMFECAKRTLLVWFTGVRALLSCTIWVWSWFDKWNREERYHFVTVRGGILGRRAKIWSYLGHVISISTVVVFTVFLPPDNEMPFLTGGAFLTTFAAYRARNKPPASPLVMTFDNENKGVEWEYTLQRRDKYIQLWWMMVFSGYWIWGLRCL